MSAKIKKKKLKILGDDQQDITEMFNQMISGGTDINVIYPKYQKVAEILTKVAKLLNIFTASAAPLFELPEFSGNFAEINAFSANIMRAIRFDYDFSRHMSYTEAPKDTQRAFLQFYTALKSSDVCKFCITSCGELLMYQQQIEAENVNFLNGIADVSWRPLTFTGFDFRQLVILDISPRITAIVLSVIRGILIQLLALHEQLTSPDIDINKFAELMIKALDSVQSRPELNRCKKAFAKLRESVSLLKSEFKTYYNDFLETKDATVIMQNFVADVSKRMDGDAELTREFRIIMQYYAKFAQSSETSSNPKIKMLFDRVNESLDILDRPGEMVHIKQEPAE